MKSFAKYVQMQETRERIDYFTEKPHIAQAVGNLIHNKFDLMIQQSKMQHVSPTLIYQIETLQKMFKDAAEEMRWNGYDNRTLSPIYNFAQQLASEIREKGIEQKSQQLNGLARDIENLYGTIKHDVFNAFVG